MDTKKLLMETYPMMHKDKTLYRFKNSSTRIGTDDNDVEEITDPSGKWYKLLMLLDGNKNAQKALNKFNENQSLSQRDFIAIISKLREKGVLSILKRPFREMSQNLRYQTDLTYYFSEGFDGSSVLKKLQDLHVTVLGAGGAGSQISLQLASLGVGNIHIVDPDIIESSNLNRQYLFSESEIGTKKVDAVKSFIETHDSNTSVSVSYRRIKSISDVTQEIKGADWVFCAIDEPPYIAQRIVNNACFIAGIPSLYGFSSRDSAKMFIVRPNQSGCADCLLGSRADNDFINLISSFQSSSSFTPTTPTITPNLCLEISWIVKKWLDDYLARTDNSNTLFRFDFNLLREDPFISFNRKETCPTCGEKKPTQKEQQLWRLIQIN